MNTLWPASLADQAMESPHGIHAFRTALFENPSLHFHQSNEFFLLVAGQARQRLGDRCTPMQAGDLHFLPARSWHIADAEEEVPAIVLNFYDTSFSRSIPADREALAIVRHLAERSRAVDSAIPLTEPVRTKAASLLEESAGECETHPPGWQSAVKIQLHALLLLVLRETSAGEALRGQALPHLTDAHTARIEKALAHAQEHLAEPLSVAGISRVAGMGHTRFCEAFKAYTGYTLIDYVNRLRVDRACFLLTRDDRPLPMVAETCGFRCVSHFHAIFRSLTGRSPHQFRKLATHKPSP